MEDTTISPYTVRAGSFEGPLELLLSLIESRKLFVNDVSLADVTTDYIEYVKNLSNIPTEKRMADISYFIVIAATLILVKSKSLLPNLNLTDEETEKIVDLESRLKAYQIIKNASLEIRNIAGVAIIFSPEERNIHTPIFTPEASITVPTLVRAIQDVLTNVPKKKEVLPEIEVKKVISIDEMINSLTDRIENAVNMSFASFAKSHGGANMKEVKIHTIVSFLAMLELVRGGIIDVIQNNTFEDMQITKQQSAE